MTARRRLETPWVDRERTPSAAPGVKIPALVEPTDPALIARARLAVCARATDVDDARYLLAALGLLAHP